MALPAFVPMPRNGVYLPMAAPVLSTQSPHTWVDWLMGYDTNGVGQVIRTGTDPKPITTMTIDGRPYVHYATIAPRIVNSSDPAINDMFYTPYYDDDMKRGTRYAFAYVCEGGCRYKRLAGQVLDRYSNNVHGYNHNYNQHNHKTVLEPLPSPPVQEHHLPPKKTPPMRTPLMKEAPVPAPAPTPVVVAPESSWENEESEPLPPLPRLDLFRFAVETASPSPSTPDSPAESATVRPERREIAGAVVTMVTLTQLEKEKVAEKEEKAAQPQSPPPSVSVAVQVPGPRKAPPPAPIGKRGIRMFSRHGPHHHRNHVRRSITEILEQAALDTPPPHNLQSHVPSLLSK